MAKSEIEVLEIPYTYTTNHITNEGWCIAEKAYRYRQYSLPLVNVYTRAHTWVAYGKGEEKAEQSSLKFADPCNCCDTTCSKCRSFERKSEYMCTEFFKTTNGNDKSSMFGRYHRYSLTYEIISIIGVLSTCACYLIIVWTIGKRLWDTVTSSYEE